MNLGTHKVGQSVSTYPKGTVSRKPQAQKIRVKSQYVAGVPQRKIAKIENISKTTVAKIVKEPDVAKYVEELRERFYGLGDLAIAATQYQLEVKKDGHLGHRILEGMGVVPAKQTTLKLQTQDTSSMSPEQGYSRQAIMMSNALLESHEAFGVDLPDDMMEKLMQGEMVVDKVEKKKE